MHAVCACLSPCTFATNMRIQFPVAHPSLVGASAQRALVGHHKETDEAPSKA